jgi:hypothetical protein
MLTVSSNASDQDVVEILLCQWVGALANGSLDLACNMLFDNSDWVNPQMIEALVSNHGLLEQPVRLGPHRVTSPSSAIGTPCHSVKRRRLDSPDGIAGDAFIELPLDGEWSSLTAVFIIYNVDGRLAFKLEALEVP